MVAGDNAIAKNRKVWYNMLKFSLGVIFMTENEVKYRRWGWGAVLGLAAVIIIAGIVMAATLSSPKPNTANTEPETTTEQPNTVASTEEKKEETKSETKEETKKETQDEVIKNHINPDHNASSTSNSNSSSTSSTSNTSSTSSASNMPKTGPEDAVLPIFALAVSGALIAYNLTLTKKNA